MGEMRYRLIALTVAAVLLVAVPAAASELELEEGATFLEDGTCYEADGTYGLSSFDGQCVTPADYDLIFGFTNLHSIEHPLHPGRSIADVHGITADDPPASLRVRSFMGDELETFSAVVYRLTSGRLAL